MRVLVTSGGTKTPIDEVRHIGNMSSGTFGRHLANALLEEGHEVVFLYAKGSKAPHEIRVDLRKDCTEEKIDILMFWNNETKYSAIEYDNFEDYKKKLKEQLTLRPDVIILAAAVSDYAPERVSGKISSELENMDIHLVKTPKLIRMVKDMAPDSFLVGFKLLVGSTDEDLLEAMRGQAWKAKADLVVGNDLRDIKADKHRLTVFSSKDERVTTYKDMSGKELAESLVKQIQECMTHE